MKKHKFYIEEIVEEIRGLSEYYPLSFEDGEAFEVKPKEVKAFTEELIATLKRYLDVDVSDDEDDAEDDDDIDMFLFDVDDDLS